MADEFNPIATGLEIGQGEAQVFKPFQDNYADKIAELQVKKLAESEKKKAEFGGELDKLNKIAIHPNDQPYFSGEIGKIRQFAAKNGESLWKGNDPAKEMEFQQLINDFTTKAEYSKFQRDKVEGLAMDYAKNPDKVGKSQMEYIQSYTPIDPATGKMIQPDLSKLSYNIPAPKDEVDAILKSSDELFKPNQRVVKTRDADGRVIETENQFFNNPIAQSKHLLQKEPIKVWAIQQFEQLPPEKQDKYESKAVKSGNTVYEEWLTDYNKQRIGLKSSSEDLSPVEKGGGINLDFMSGGGSTPAFTFKTSHTTIPKQEFLSGVKEYKGSEEDIQSLAKQYPGDYSVNKISIAPKRGGENKPLEYPLDENTNVTEKFKPISVFKIGDNYYLEGKKGVTDKDGNLSYGKKFIRKMDSGLIDYISTSFDNFIDNESFDKFMNSASPSKSPQGQGVPISGGGKATSNSKFKGVPKSGKFN